MNISYVFSDANIRNNFFPTTSDFCNSRCEQCSLTILRLGLVCTILLTFWNSAEKESEDSIIELPQTSCEQNANEVSRNYCLPVKRFGGVLWVFSIEWIFGWSSRGKGNISFHPGEVCCYKNISILLSHGVRVTLNSGWATALHNNWPSFVWVWNTKLKNKKFSKHKFQYVTWKQL